MMKKMELKKISEIMNEQEARNVAIKYQGWASGESLRYGEVAYYSNYFRTLAEKFGLIEEFEENGIL